MPVLLLVLNIFGPISMDLYLPALPALTADLNTTTSAAQLTITACLIGLATGQLIAGPISDGLGRRRVLLAGVIAYVLTSGLCALSPSVGTLTMARLAQGLAGGVGIVITQAAGRDMYSGVRLIRFYGRLTVIGGLAAIIGPLLGGLLSAFVSWRGLFILLAVIGIAILMITLTVFQETLPPERRARGGFSKTFHDYSVLLSDRVFVGAVLNQGFLYAALFAYLAGATYVLQDIYGLTPQEYALAFGVNSVGFMVSGYLGGRVAQRWSVVGAVAVGIAAAAIGAGGLLVSGLVTTPAPVVLGSLFALASGVAFSSPPATTLALVDYSQIAGTASSLLGVIRFGFGALSAPLVGLAGAHSMLPLGLVTTVAVVLAVAAFAVIERAPGGPEQNVRPDPNGLT